MIDVGATKGVYVYDVIDDTIRDSALGKLTAKALHDPRIDKEAFRPLLWRYLRRGRYVRSQGHARYFKADLRTDVYLFDLTPEDLG